MGFLDFLGGIVDAFTGGVNTAVNAVNDVAKTLPGNQKPEQPKPAKAEQKPTAKATPQQAPRADAQKSILERKQESEQGKKDAKQQPTVTTEIHTQQPQGEDEDENLFESAVKSLFSLFTPEQAEAAELEQKAEEQYTPANTSGKNEKTKENPNGWDVSADGTVLSPQTSEAIEKLSKKDANGADVKQLAPGIYVDNEAVRKNFPKSDGEMFGDFLMDIQNFFNQFPGNQKVDENTPGIHSDIAPKYSESNENPLDSVELTDPQSKYEAAMAAIDQQQDGSFIDHFQEAVDTGALVRPDGTPGAGTAIKLSDFAPSNDEVALAGNEKYAAFFVDTALSDYYTLISHPDFKYYYDKTWSDMNIDLKTYDGPWPPFDEKEFESRFKKTDEYGRTVQDSFDGSHMSGLGGDQETVNAMTNMLGSMGWDPTADGTLTADQIAAAGADPSTYNDIIAALANNSEINYMIANNLKYSRGESGVSRYNQAHQGMRTVDENGNVRGEALQARYQADPVANINGQSVTGRTTRETGHIEEPRKQTFVPSDYSKYGVTRTGNMKALQNVLPDEEESEGKKLYWYETQ